jgi:hypothetical protein
MRLLSRPLPGGCPAVTHVASGLPTLRLPLPFLSLLLNPLQHLMEILFHHSIVTVLNVLLVAAEFAVERLQANVKLQVRTTGLTGKNPSFTGIGQPARLETSVLLHGRLGL